MGALHNHQRSHHLSLPRYRLVLKVPPRAGRLRKVRGTVLPVNLAKGFDNAEIGRCTYEFSTVVTLREQMGVTDQEWRDSLSSRDRCVTAFLCAM